jgi:hypothetical protein
LGKQGLRLLTKAESYLEGFLEENTSRGRVHFSIKEKPKRYWANVPTASLVCQVPIRCHDDRWGRKKSTWGLELNLLEMEERRGKQI